MSTTYRPYAETNLLEDLRLLLPLTPDTSASRLNNEYMRCFRDLTIQLLQGELIILNAADYRLLLRLARLGLTQVDTSDPSS